MLKNIIIPLLLTLCIGGALINVDIFVGKTLAAYFFYTILVCLFALFVLISKVSEKTSVSISLPVIFFLLFTLYIFIQGLVTSTVWLTQYYWITHAILFISLVYYLSDYGSRQHLLLFFKGIVLFAVIESAIVILQFAGLIITANKYFKATGTWVNPNVTAMFLTMVLPIMLFIFYDNEMRGKKLQLLFFLLVSVALLLLKCRTAFIGVLLIAGYILNEHYGLLRNIKARFSGIKLATLTVFATVAIIIGSYGMYISKKDSADGRKLIWKICTVMIAKKPMTGYGYGSFEKNYNLAQADYFVAGNGSEYEKLNASYVHMGYNEFLQNAVEGGIIGLTLFMLLLASLLFTKTVSKTSVNNKTLKSINENVIAKAGIIAFSVMSVLNFTLEAVPAMGMFVIYAAILCSGNDIRLSQKLIVKPILVSTRIITTILFVTSILTGYNQILLANAFKELKKANDLSMIRDYESADFLLEPLKSRIQKSEIYWKTCATVAYKQKQYSEAAAKYKQALLISSNPDLYLQAANCYEKTKEQDSALTAYTMAKNITPGRLLPRYQLMNFYLRSGDTANAGLTAYEIMAIEPKILTKEALYYKNAAKNFIAKNKL